ncbi:hypothetical protein GOBAR_DD01557 [Gossypium barbadense]|nr:hypothetical protein GOBAR_DD01557 [Gossypium barbadense]
MTRLESDIKGETNTLFRQWLGIIKPWQWAQSFNEGFRYGHMTNNLVEGVNFVLMKTRHLSISSVLSVTFYRLATLMPRMRQQQVNQSEAGHVFVEDVNDTMAANHWRRFRTLHYPYVHVVAACAKVSINVEQFIDEEVPLTTFDLISDKGLRRNSKGHPQSSRIHNEIDIREKFNEKLCGVYRLAGHNQSKLPYWTIVAIK